MIREALAKLVDGQTLSEEDAYGAMQTIMAGEATEAQIGGYLIALRMAGESAAAIAGSARAMREKVTPIPTRHDLFVDTCGTGGDGAHTINISTAAALVTAAAGVPVAKHGNRSVSSKSGSADVLEALGVNIDLPPEAMTRCLDEVGIAFLFAVKLHPAMKHAIGPRKALGLRTIFNILGPLSNPAAARHGVLGVFSRDLVDTITRAALDLGFEHYLVVHGDDGLDELTTTTTSHVGEVRGGAVRFYDVNPAELGLAPATAADLRGGDPADNAQAIRTVLDGVPGPHRDVILLNAAAALVAGQAAADLKEGLRLAGEAVDSGAAKRTLDALVAWTQG